MKSYVSFYEILYRLWRLFFSRLPNILLFEMTKTCRSLGVRNFTWVNQLQLLLEKFEYGPYVNQFLVLLLTPDGKLYCPIHDRQIVKETYENKYYDRFFEPRKGFTVVDAGAHVGIYTLEAAKKVGRRGRVLSVEPSPLTYEILVTNMRMNNLEPPNVIPIKIALADFKGKTKFRVSSSEPRKSGIGFISLSTEKSIHVKVDTLDSVIEEVGIKHCDLLKIDVEGQELEVLRGAQNALKDTSMVVVAAYHFKGEKDSVEAFLKSMGFETVFSTIDSYVYALRNKPEAKI